MKLGLIRSALLLAAAAKGAVAQPAAVPTLGSNYLKAIQSVTDRPVKYLIYSHEHTDHIGGASLFPKSVQIVAQEETAAILKRRNDPLRPLPAITFHSRYTLTLGGEKLELFYPGPNHQTGNIIVWAPRQKTPMPVDVIYPRYLPYKNLGIAEQLHGLAGQILTATPFPAFIATHLSPDKWDLHNEYAKSLTERCAAALEPLWTKRLADTATYLKDNCWAMIEAITVQTAAK